MALDALALLTQQHDEAMELFKKIEESEDPKEGRRLFEELKSALELHEKLEETALYPRMKKDEQFKDETLEAYQEHHVMDVLLREITDLAPSSEQFQPKVKVLQENVEHHAKEEEEKKLFPMIRQKWSQQQLDEIGREMEAMMRERGQQRKAA